MILDHILRTILMAEAVLVVLLILPFGTSLKVAVVKVVSKFDSPGMTYVFNIVAALVVLLLGANAVTYYQFGLDDDSAQMSDHMRM
jgi:hypothetical protein